MFLTATERRQARLLKRRTKAAERAKRVLRFLLQALDATTTYRGPETPRTPRWREDTVLYGARLALKPKAGSLLDSDGKATQLEITREWSAEPGEIITSRQIDRVEDELGVERRRARRYMVQPNRSLKRI